MRTQSRIRLRLIMVLVLFIFTVFAYLMRSALNAYIHALSVVKFEMQVKGSQHPLDIESTRHVVLERLQQALLRYHDIENRFPAESEGLGILICYEDPVSKTPLIQSPFFLFDAWDNRIAYTTVPEGVLLQSFGRDLNPGTDDDIAVLVNRPD